MVVDGHGGVWWCVVVCGGVLGLVFGVWCLVFFFVFFFCLFVLLVWVFAQKLFLSCSLPSSSYLFLSPSKFLPQTENCAPYLVEGHLINQKQHLKDTFCV